MYNISNNVNVNTTTKGFTSSFLTTSTSLAAERFAAAEMSTFPKTRQ